jgi:thiol-disulfide isomerase/thioredoxin
MQFVNSKEAGMWVTNALDLVQSHLSWPILIVMFLMGCVGFAILLFFIKKYAHRIKIVEGLSSMDSPTDDSAVQLLFFTVDWCPHCKVAKPEWDNLVSEYDGKLINGRQVVFTNYNCTTETEETKKLISQYGIDGYPTIKLIKDGQVINFDAKPTKDSLATFLKSSI